MSFNGIAYPVAQTQMGLALEGTRGTGEAPTVWLPMKAPKYKPDLMLIPDQTLQGSMVMTYDLVTGIRYDAHGWNAPPYLDTFPTLLLCEFGYEADFTAAGAPVAVGADAIVPAATTALLSSATGISDGTWLVFGSSTYPANLETKQVLSIATDTVTVNQPFIYNHAIGETVTILNSHEYCLLNSADSTGNQPVSATLTDFDGEEWRQITGAQLDGLNIKGNGTSLVDYTCNWMGNPAAAYSVDPSQLVGYPYTPDYTGIQTPAPWSFYSLIGGDYTPTVMDWEFDFKRNVKPIPALTGQQEYFTYLATTLSASGKFTFVEQSGSPELNRFLDAIRQSFDFTIFDQKTGSVLNIHASNGQFKTGEIDRSKEYVTVPVEFELLPSTDDQLGSAGGVGPVVVTVANAVDTAYAP